MNDDKDDAREEKWFRHISRGDLFPIGLALVCTILFLWLMFGPSPFAGLFDHPKQAQHPSGEVSVTIPEKP